MDGTVVAARRVFLELALRCARALEDLESLITLGKLEMGR
jgi:hypothetical protein